MSSLVYAPDVRAVAKAAGIHPGDVEICEHCELLAPPLHPGCPKRKDLVFVGRFSPAGHRFLRPKGPLSFTWRRARGSALRVHLKVPPMTSWRVASVHVQIAPAGIVSHVKGIEHGWWPTFDVHCWKRDLEWGKDPVREVPDCVEFTAMLQPIIRTGQ